MSRRTTELVVVVGIAKYLGLLFVAAAFNSYTATVATDTSLFRADDTSSSSSSSSSLSFDERNDDVIGKHTAGVEPELRSGATDSFENGRDRSEPTGPETVTDCVKSTHTVNNGVSSETTTTTAPTMTSSSPMTSSTPASTTAASATTATSSQINNTTECLSRSGSATGDDDVTTTSSAAARTSDADTTPDYVYVDDVIDDERYANSGGVVDGDADADRSEVTEDTRQFAVIGYEEYHTALTHLDNGTHLEDNYQQGVEIGDSHPGAAQFRNFDVRLVRPLSGKQVGLRWVQQNHFDMRAVTYAWLALLVVMLTVACIALIIRNRHAVTSAVLYTRTQLVRRRDRWQSGAIDLRDESNTLLGHAQV